MVGMKKYIQITSYEREKIFMYLLQGKKYREIGRLLDRSHTSIKREVERNSLKLNKHREVEIEYLPSKANELSAKRRSETRGSSLLDPAVRQYVVSKLNRHWRPEQIAGRLKLKAPKNYVCTETIYKFIYAKENKELRLWEFLRKSHKKRQPLFSRKKQQAKRLQIPNKTGISERPEEAGLRLTLGHLESDLMEGVKTSKDVVSVTCDRKARYLTMDKLPNKESKPRIAVLNSRLEKLPPVLKKTITFDNGSENFYHEDLTKQNNIKTYFCQAYHSWEKGTVENTIGLVREYIPKKTDLSQVTQTDLNAVALELNTRPRKKLGFYTPEEIMLNEVEVVHFT